MHYAADSMTAAVGTIDAQTRSVAVQPYLRRDTVDKIAKVHGFRDCSQRRSHPTANEDYVAGVGADGVAAATAVVAADDGDDGMEAVVCHAEEASAVVPSASSPAAVVEAFLTPWWRW